MHPSKSYAPKPQVFFMELSGAINAPGVAMENNRPNIKNAIKRTTKKIIAFFVFAKKAPAAIPIAEPIRQTAAIAGQMRKKSLIFSVLLHHSDNGDLMNLILDNEENSLISLAALVISASLTKHLFRITFRDDSGKHEIIRLVISLCDGRHSIPMEKTRLIRTAGTICDKNTPVTKFFVCSPEKLSHEKKRRRSDRKSAL